MPGTENAGADLLSRPISGLRSKDTSGPISGVNQTSVWDEIWEEHLKGHWGVYKTFHALKHKCRGEALTMWIDVTSCKFPTRLGSGVVGRSVCI